MKKNEDDFLTMKNKNKTENNDDQLSLKNLQALKD